MAHIPLGSLPALNGARFDVIAQVELAVVHENVDVYAHAVVHGGAQRPMNARATAESENQLRLS